MFRNTQSFSSYSFSDAIMIKTFYAEVLDLKVTEQPEGLLVHLSGGGKVFLYPKAEHTPATFTVLNFVVPDIEAAVAQLKKRKVVFEHYEDLKTDKEGIFRSDDRELGGPAAIAWFKDPSGNILSVIQERSTPRASHK